MDVFCAVAEAEGAQVGLDGWSSQDRGRREIMVGFAVYVAKERAIAQAQFLDLPGQAVSIPVEEDFKKG